MCLAISAAVFPIKRDCCVQLKASIKSAPMEPALPIIKERMLIPAGSQKRRVFLSSWSSPAIVLAVHSHIFVSSNIRLRIERRLDAIKRVPAAIPPAGEVTREMPKMNAIEERIPETIFERLDQIDCSLNFALFS